MPGLVAGAGVWAKVPSANVDSAKAVNLAKFRVLMKALQLVRNPLMKPLLCKVCPPWIT